MKKRLLILSISCAFSFSASSQNTRVWATYYGGGYRDDGTNIATDKLGNVYVVGETESDTGIATPGAYQTVYKGLTDAFLVKFNSSGVRQWATYYGGTDGDFATGVDVDSAGNVYMVGFTYSDNGIATAGAYHPTFHGGTSDGFLVKFNSSGVRQWATYAGGAGFDLPYNVSLDRKGNAYIAGYTYSSDSISTPGAFQVTYADQGDVFLLKFNSSGSILWGTYYGGTDQDGARDVATDSSGNVYIAGFTKSLSGVASGGFQNTFGGDMDALIVKFDSSGNRIWGSYYGGPGVEQGEHVTRGAGGSVYMCGITNSASGIASGGYQNTFAGWTDAFLVKFDATGGRQWGTYYGGTEGEEGWGVATDAWGNVFLTLDSYSPNVANSMSTPSGFQTTRDGQENHVLVAFNGYGNRISATYYGKEHEEDCRVALSSDGSVYIEGYTPHPLSGIATAGSHQSVYGGGPHDAFLVKFNNAIPHEDVIVPNDTVPPGPSVVTTIPPKLYISINIFIGGGITISNAVFKKFSPGAPLPSSGSSTITFTSDFTGDYNNGSASIPVACTANMKMKVTYLSTSGSTRYYDTEMLQLDLSGGTMPTGVRFRESPTLASTGMISFTDIGGGLFNMASYFDMFTELSTDGGSNWTPDTQPSARLTLRDSVTASVPTLSEWGLILLSGLMLSIGIMYIKLKTS